MASIKSFPNNQDEYVGAEYIMKWLHGRTSGVFGANGNAAVSALETPGMAVTVSDGVGWMANGNGDGVVWWNDSEAVNTSKLQLGIDSADGVLNRIDRIIVEWKTTNYVDLPEIKVLKGSASSTAKAPSLTNNSTVRQISLARISVNAGVTAITASMITDERLDTSVCGLVTDRVSIDTSMMHNQFEVLLNAISEELNRLNSGTEVVLKSGGVQEPVNSDQVANKGYVDASVRKAAPYNYAHNSDFTQFVAQAGVGGLHGTQAYAGDRWILDSGTVTGEANENGNGYRNITLNGTIRQIIANPPAVGTAGVEMISGTAAVSYANGELTITSAGGIIKNVLLCAAETLPEYQPKGYGAELAECLRYYYRLSNNEVYAVQNPGSLYNATTVRTTFTLPVEMRVNPTVSILSGSVAEWGVFTIDGLVHPTAYTVRYQLKNRAVSFVLTIPSKTTQRPAVVCISSSIDFSADL